MENDQPSTDQSSLAPESPMAAEDPEKKNNKKTVAPTEIQAGVVGLTSTSINNQPRSYECIFCKRGFANAQALGGHMNIHRKDKEKLKNQYLGTSSIDQTARLMDMVIPRMIQHRPQAPPPPPPPPVVSWGNWMIQEEGRKAEEVKGQGHENDQLPSKRGEVRKLPLFVDRPSNQMDREEQRVFGDREDVITPSRDYEDVDEGKSSSEGRDSSEVTAVDLELRLGPEPSDPSPQPLSTRKFF